MLKSQKMDIKKILNTLWEHTTRGWSKLFYLKVWVGHRSRTQIFPKPWNFWQCEDNFIPMLNLQEAHLKGTQRLPTLEQWIIFNISHYSFCSQKRAFLESDKTINPVLIITCRGDSSHSWWEQNMESEKMQMSVASLKKTVPKREGNYFNYVHSFDATVTVSIKAPEKMSCHLCDSHNKN